ncbi:hypothetical protein ACT0L2_004876, partial [Escherichia coli]
CGRLRPLQLTNGLLPLSPVDCMSAHELSHKALEYEVGEILPVSPFFAQLLQYQINQELYYLTY